MMPSGTYCSVDNSKIGTFLLISLLLMPALIGTVYAYRQVYLELRSLSRVRRPGAADIATQQEAIIGMKMVLMMVLWVLWYVHGHGIGPLSPLSAPTPLLPLPFPAGRQP